MLVQMAQVLPFRPYRYSPKAGDLATLVTQPYDKVPDALREQYLQASPYNFVRLIKGQSLDSDDGVHNVYSRASDTLEAWIQQGILAQDPDPGFYAYFQEFDHPETGAKTIRKGFIGLTDVEEYDKGVVHRHELTHSGPKMDRWKLTEATQSYFGQLFFLYDDPTRQVDKLLHAAAVGQPLMEAHEPAGITHKVWRMSDPAQVAEIQRLMADKKLLIADGHHRYETALAYGREHPETPGASQVMVTLVNISSAGLVVLATHRVLSDLPDFEPGQLLERASRRFEVRRLATDDALRRALDAEPHSGAAIGLVLAGDEGHYLLTPKPGALEDILEGLSEAERRPDVVLLHKALIGEAAGLSEDDVRELKGIRYVRGFANAIAEVASGAAQAAFLLRPVDVKDVARISFSGGVMPQKSTDFYPKLLSGFTTYRFGPPIAK
jgi:uncharacterized protein (DUF1015 family)